jgi:hypothetical protein
MKNKINQILITTQSEFNALPGNFDNYTKIIIPGGTIDNKIIIKKNTYK